MHLIKVISILVVATPDVLSYAITFRDTGNTTFGRNNRRPSLQIATSTSRPARFHISITLPPTQTPVSTTTTTSSPTRSSRNHTVIGEKSYSNASLNSTTNPGNNSPNNGSTTESNSIIKPTDTACQMKNDSSLPKTSSYFTDDFIWKKLCPNVNTTEMESYRFDLDSKVCSEVNLKSHCGKNMNFRSYRNSELYGYCDCDYSLGFPLMFHANTNRCYFAYQQGPCKIDEWLEIKGNGSFVCAKNKCYNSGRTKFGAEPLAARDMQPEYVPLNGNGPCVRYRETSEQHCGNKQEKVLFRMWPQENLYPHCGPEPLARFLGDVAPIECTPGSYQNVMGVCQPEWEFD